MSHLELKARLKIRPGQLEGFKAQAAEILRLTRELDTETLRYDWFISEDGTECEVHEAYLSEEGFFEHTMHIMEARKVIFEKYAYGHEMTAYGEVPQSIVDAATIHAGGIKLYSFLHGLELAPTV
jgi:quinol monooxygenase YgiN